MTSCKQPVDMFRIPYNRSLKNDFQKCQIIFHNTCSEIRVVEDLRNRWKPVQSPELYTLSAENFSVKSDEKIAS